MSISFYVPKTTTVFVTTSPSIWLRTKIEAELEGLLPEENESAIQPIQDPIDVLFSSSLEAVLRRYPPSTYPTKVTLISSSNCLPHVCCVLTFRVILTLFQSQA